jgi:hypothetical protein
MRKNRRRAEIMHSSIDGKWRNSTGARRKNKGRSGLNMRYEIIIAVWQKN